MNSDLFFTDLSSQDAEIGNINMKPKLVPQAHVSDNSPGTYNQNQLRRPQRFRRAGPIGHTDVQHPNYHNGLSNMMKSTNTIFNSNQDYREIQRQQYLKSESWNRRNLEEQRFRAKVDENNRQIRANLYNQKILNSND